jgi:HEAT repeat protein
MSARRIGILTTDTALVVTSWDASLAAMTGLDGAEAAGRPLTEVVPDLEARGLLEVLREPLESGAARVLAPALHGHLIPCPPATPSAHFGRMQQRVVIGALREGNDTVGLIITVEDVTERLDREHALAEELRHASPDARMRAIEHLASVEPVDGIGPVSHALGDDEWRVRRTAVEALAGRRDPALVGALVSALRDGHRNFSVLSSALQLLTVTGVDVTAALVDLLRHRDADLRIQAALALGMQARPEAAAALLEALDDPDANVRFHAIEALGKVAPSAAVEPLAVIAESGDFFLAFPALDALARISDPAVAPRIVPLLRDALVSGQAAEALGQIGDEDAVAPLLAVLDRPDASASSIVDALAAIHRRYSEMFGAGAQIEDLVRRSVSAAAAQRIIDGAARASGAALRHFVLVLGWLRGAAVERALTHLLGTPAVQHELIEAIVRFGAPMVDLLVEQLGRDDLDTRRAAVTALGYIGDTRAVPALIALLDEGDRQLLVPVAGALARLGDRRAFEPLVRRLGDEDLAVRHAAIGALNSIGDPEMGARMQVLLGDPDPLVRESAVKIGGYFGYAICTDGLLERCRDAVETVRAAALEHVAFLEDDRVMPVLVGALEGETPRARAAAAQALAHVESPEAARALRRGVQDPDPWVRYFSAASLGRLADACALPLLEALARNDPFPHVRMAAVDAIGVLGGDRAGGVLSALTESENPAVATAAVRALGAVNAASALEPLRRALSGPDALRRAAAADALARWGGEPAVALLRWTASADSEPEVVRAAIGGLCCIGNRATPASQEAIGALAEVAIDPARRADAIAAMARLTADAIPAVGGCLSARDPNVRRAVVEALGRLSHPTASAYVRSALEDGDASVRQTAVSVLAGLGTRGVARSFAKLARTDPSGSVRQAAEAALRRARRDSNKRSRDQEVSLGERYDS